METESQSSRPSRTHVKGALAISALAFLCLLLFVLVYWFSVRHSGSDIPPIRIAVASTPLSAPVYIAEEKGFFDDHCSEVELIDFVGGKRSFESMISGQADFSTSSDSVIVYKSFIRSDFVTLASFVHSDNDVKFITREDRSLVGGRDFRSRKIGVVKGASSEYFLSTYLALEGVSIDEVTLVNLSPDEMPEKLATGEVDAIVPWEPYGYKTVQSMEGNANVFPTKNLYSLSFNLIGNKNNLYAHPEKAECVLAALSDAIDYMSANHTETQNVLSRRLQLDNDFIYWIWPDYIFKLSLNKSLLMNLDSQADWFVQSGIYKGVDKPDFTEVIDPSFLAKVKPEAVTLLDQQMLSAHLLKHQLEND